MQRYLAFALTLFALHGHAARADALKAGVFEPPRAAPEIVLPSAGGKPFKLSEQRGKVVVLEFGYTHCVDVCPVSLAALTQARQKLGAAGADVQLVFITVDPARDDAARLRNYLKPFDPGIAGLTGSGAQIDAVLKAYGISATRRPIDGSATDYTMHHSSYLYFIDRKGMQRALMPFGRPVDDIVHDLALLLKN
ncbi:MAG TPA: SCO family protein [Burkholderiaceae bacterium]|nr:SCO family protein [Burkholderiaceae bacterium]